MISIPFKIVEFIKSNTLRYQEILNKTNRKITLDFSKPTFDLFEMNSRLVELHEYMHIKAKAISAVHAFGAQFPNEFVSDLNLLMSKHKIELNMNQFLHSIDASRLVFTLLRDVFIRIPYTVVEFEPKNIAKSVDTIKKWIAENFSRFTTRIWNQAFYIEPIVYSRPVEEQFIKSCTYLVENFETMFNLLKVKRNEITVYSKHVDLVCFDKFMSILNEKRDLFSGVSIESATFENDLKIVQELLLFTNLCLSTNS